MSATTAALQIQVFPPPPTLNTLDAKQRSRLLRSARKLEALLGETPILLEPEPSPVNNRTHLRPSRSTRRDGGIYKNDISNSSLSSLDFFNSESESYVEIASNVPSAPYQVQAILDDDCSPSSSRSASPAPTKKKHKGSSTGVTLENGRGRGKGPQGISQPLLLRLRARPSDGRPPLHAHTHTGASPSVLDLTIPPPSPLSPISTSFNAPSISSDADSVLMSPTLPSADPFQLSDKDKRKKMAKLARTLGENIPPELVFHNNTITLSSSPGVARTNSLSLSTPRTKNTPTGHKLTKSVGGAGPGGLPILAVAESPLPPSPPKPSSFDEISRPLSSTARPNAAAIKRKRRPRSLTLGTVSAFASPALLAATSRFVSPTKDKDSSASSGAAYVQHTRGTGSLDSPRLPVHPTQPQTHAREVLAHPGMRQDQPFAIVLDVSSTDDEVVEVKKSVDTVRPSMEGNGKAQRLGVDWDGRRKEREWSGEWNVKDMERVTKALRELKGR